MEGARLWEAHLEVAFLSQVHLERANLFAAHMERADLTQARLEGADLKEAHLERAVLPQAHLEEAFLYQAHLEEAYLEGAYLEGAYLGGAHMEGADLEGAHLEGVDFSDTFLQGTNCRKAIVDGETLIWGCEINKRGIREKNYTDFAGVGLEAARIQPQIKQLLEYNIRKSNWSLWYIRLWNRNLFTKIISSPLVPIKWILVRPFWWISNYGLSTWRIIITFFGLAVVFALAYRLWPNCVLVNGQVGDIRGFVHALYFSVVTMTTLGFGDIAANPDSWQGQVLLMVQVILGYVLLAALVTRFAVLFTAGGPAGRFAEKKK